MKSFLSEFKTFALRGNVVELAVAFTVGAAFSKIVSSLVDNVLMPIISILLGIVNFSSLSLEIGKTTIRYGAFIQSIIDFFFIALAVFLMVKAMNAMKRKEEEKPTEPPAEDIALLREIRDSLKK